MNISIPYHIKGQGLILVMTVQAPVTSVETSLDRGIVLPIMVGGGYMLRRALVRREVWNPASVKGGRVEERNTKNT